MIMKISPTNIPLLNDFVLHNKLPGEMEVFHSFDEFGGDANHA